MPLDFLLVAFAFAALFLGYSVGITLGGVALGFAVVAWLFGGFDGALLLAVPSRIFGIMTNPTLLAIPLFVLMGLVIEKAGLADDMFDVLGSALAGRRGGLTLSVTLVGALLAASTGIVGASVVTLGVLALPALLQRGVEPGYAGGSIAAAGTLGQIIPPAIVLIVLADQLSNAYQQVQLQQGNFAPDTLSVADMFAAALMPGLLLAALIALYQWCRGGAGDEPNEQSNHYGIMEVVKAVIAPLLMIFMVLGSILGGVATPTEASAVGCVAALLLAGNKHAHGGSYWFTRLPLIGVGGLIVLVMGRGVFGAGAIQNAANIGLLFVVVIAVGISFSNLIKVQILMPALDESVHLISMIFVIVIGASIFSLVFRGLGGDVRVASLFADMPGGAWGGVIIALFVIFVLGFFLEFLEITYLVVPIVVPILLTTPFADGTLVNPLWLGVAIALVLQTSFLTPPFGVALFYLRSVAPGALTTVALYRGVIPFVLLQIAALGLVLVFPDLATWLPDQLFEN